ncbi:TPA: putative holin-like toxin [Streptococcus agalactiae]|nr:putative holin-like toxin [Streptococcus agalactiae]HEN0994291.1 putative holin-like toxin [Streptococcus agalactiae]HEO2641681.1 putative holin-like toxin [Streptococcus agalactiae]
MSHQNPTERSLLLSIFEAIQLMIAFSILILTLISIVIALINLNDKK